MEIEIIFSETNVESFSVHANCITVSPVSSNPNDLHAKAPKTYSRKF